MLSSSRRSAPAARATSTSASEPHSTSTGTPCGRRLERPADGLLDPARERDVVVLDQDRVEEAHPVVVTAAGRHGLLLERRAARASSCACRAPSRRCPAARARTPPSRSRCPTGGRGSSAPPARPSRAHGLRPRAPAHPPAARPAIHPPGAGARSRTSGSRRRKTASATSRPNTTPGAFCTTAAAGRAARRRRPPPSSCRAGRRPRRARARSDPRRPAQAWSYGIDGA